ncbi:MAG TPA: zinc-ribbon domain-containing protein [Pyrinomonadaceae bacterium]|nr:zinc-ribbon domain-containing protein [Pyrinomonadaceae bacterium]
MSEPEIDKRCPTCGASVRASAFFCPQCGKDLRQIARAEKLTQTTAPLETPSAEAASAVDLSVTQPIEQADESKAARSTRTARVGSTPAPLGKVKGGIQRATTIARDVEGNVTHRVQKVREISSVVLDEAGDDPSLRFVLVAGALFVLFLVIVLLNKLIS